MNIIQQFFKLTSPDDFQDFKMDNEFPFACSLFWKDRAGKYRANNQTHTSVAGCNESKDLLGLTDHDLVWSKSASLYMANDKIVVTRRSPAVFMECGATQHHKKVYFLCAKTPLILKSNRIDGVLGLGILFTMEQSNELLSKLFITKENCLKYINNFPKLTQRQLDCLFYLTLGMTQREIAIQMNLSAKTIEHYLDAVKMKLRCNNRSQLIYKALKIPSIRDRLKSA